MNLPNILTLIRLFMVPLYVVVFQHEEGVRLFSTLIFVLASVTDVLDGYLARKLNMSTKWGQLMDPLADKCMQLAVILTLFFAGQVPVWFLIILVVKELMMITGSAFLFSKKTYVKANITGKLSTVVLFLVMTLLLLIPSMNAVLKTILLGCSAVLALSAAITYLYLYFVQDQSFRKYAPKSKKGESL
ncbi:MAG: CDP-diacylglycerol--glycerol-3-phosphate 3-phosphatidyltransferase [Clostridia bacterium]|nr:CDP-diacylglycerol--glycerol-3-phosphate 3-phosphatidyltransferase [Clostridia bacterium]